MQTMTNPSCGRACAALVFLSVVVSGSADDARPEFQSSRLSVGLAPATPAFAFFAVDSLGRGERLENVILNRKLGEGNSTLEALEQNAFRYTQLADGKPIELWRVKFSEHRIVLRSEFVPHATVPPFVLLIDQKKNHATLLGHLVPGEMKVRTPAVLHLPDQGTFRITANHTNAALDYDARRRQPENFVRVEFPPATKEQGMVEYTQNVTLIHPELPGLADNPLYDGYRRSFLNLIQLHPRLRTLANNSSSDVCGFCLWQYAELAVQESAAAKAERIVKGELTKRKWDEKTLAARRKGDARKVVAQRLRRETTVTLAWIADRLQMGTQTHLAHLLYWSKRDEK